MSDPLKITFDPHKIYDEIQKSTDVSVYEVGELIIADTERFVPMKTGMLRESAHIEGSPTKGEIKIAYSRPLSLPKYKFDDDVAGAVYQGINPVRERAIFKWTTPGTGPYWDEESEDENLDDWIDYFAERTKQIWAERKRRQRSKKK